jgi:hypothetical protein
MQGLRRSGTKISPTLRWREMDSNSRSLKSIQLGGVNAGRHGSMVVQGVGKAALLIGQAQPSGHVFASALWDPPCSHRLRSSHA